MGCLGAIPFIDGESIECWAAARNRNVCDAANDPD
jgi:hypothetical protein